LYFFYLFFFTMRLYRFPVKSCFFCSLQNSYFKGLLSLTIMISNQPSFFQLVSIMDRFTFWSASTNVNFFSWKTFYELNKIIQGRIILFSRQRFTFFFPHSHCVCCSCTVICIIVYVCGYLFWTKGQRTFVFSSS
jgi:hypothetical protein